MALGPLAALLGASLTGAPVVVVEANVTQFKLAAHAAESHLPGAVEVEPGAADLEAQLKQAPVVVALGRKALAVSREHAGNRPVVFCMVLGVGAADLAPNVTGVPLEADPKEVLARIRAALPAAKRVGVVHDPRATALLMERAKAAAGALG